MNEVSDDNSEEGEMFDNWKLLAMVVALAVAAAMLVASFTIFARDQVSDGEATARAALSNCEQIEVVKEQIRESVQASKARMPQIDYYKTHPAELKQALEDVEASVVRFKARDCYDLPAVRRSGIKRPPQEVNQEPGPN